MPVIKILIHGTAYDISNFHDHPGGIDFLVGAVDKEDATTLFEMHHLRIERARSRLRALPKLYEVDSFKSEWDWSEHGFYATLRRHAVGALLNQVGYQCTDLNEKSMALAPVSLWQQATASTKAMQATRVFAVFLYFFMFSMLCVYQSKRLAIICGVLTAVLGGFGHNALHQRGRTWDCWLFEIAGFSHREYRIGEHAAHHAAPNLADDPDVTFMLPYVEFGPPRKSTLNRRITSVIAFHVLAAIASIMLIVKRVVTPRLRRHSGIVAPLIQLLLLVLSGICFFGQRFQLNSSGFSFTSKSFSLLWDIGHAVGLWILMWLAGSFYFMTITNVTHHQQRNWTAIPHESHDWGEWQMATASDIEIPFGLRGVPVFGMMFIFLHEQTLHHLFPSIDHSRLPLLRPLVSRIAGKYLLTLEKPENFLRLYIGMLETVAGAPLMKQIQPTFQ